MASTILSRFLAALLFVICALPARACLWDNDTLEAEAKGIPDTIAVITGRFERNPDLYYQMRLARVEKEVGSTPDKLELYDDAGVACDRLHQGDAAIAWMAKKRAQMEKLSASADAGVLREHRYRTLANEGTFIAHRWLRSGADRKKISEMKRAQGLIAAAIRLNPDAHFGREKYQLKAMEWIINSPKYSANDMELPTFLGENSWKSAAEAAKGISGLIVLGDAWQSADIFNALAKAIQQDEQRSSFAFMARLRACELVDDGHKSALPDAPKGNALKKLLIGQGNMTHYIEDSNIPALKSKFKNLRDEADDWHAQRTAFMIERLKAGRHPDTDKTFWDEWQEPSAPSLYVPGPRDRFYKTLNLSLAVGGVFFACWIAWITARGIKKRKTAGG